MSDHCWAVMFTRIWSVHVWQPAAIIGNKPGKAGEDEREAECVGLNPGHAVLRWTASTDASVDAVVRDGDDPDIIKTPWDARKRWGQSVLWAKMVVPPASPCSYESVCLTAYLQRRSHCCVFHWDLATVHSSRRREESLRPVVFCSLCVSDRVKSL